MNEHEILQKFKYELSHGVSLTAIIGRIEPYLQEHKEWLELFEFYITLKQVQHEKD